VEQKWITRKKTLISNKIQLGGFRITSIVAASSLQAKIKQQSTLMVVLLALLQTAQALWAHHGKSRNN